MTEEPKRVKCPNCGHTFTIEDWDASQPSGVEQSEPWPDYDKAFGRPFSNPRAFPNYGGSKKEEEE